MLSAERKIRGNPCLQLTVLLIFCFSFLLHPVQASASAILELDHPSYLPSLSSHLDILDDPDQRFSAQDILRNSFLNGFTPINLDKPYALNKYSEHIWLSANIRNNQRELSNLWLNLRSHNILSLTIYKISPAGNVTKLPINQKNDHYLSPLLISPDETLHLLIQLSFSSKKLLEVDLVNPGQFHLSSTIHHYHLGILFGTLLSCIFLALICFWYYKQQVFFFFSLQIIASLALQLVHTPLDWAWLKTLSYLDTLLMILIISLSSLGQWYFYLKSWSLEKKYQPFFISTLMAVIVSAMIAGLTVSHYSPYLWAVYILQLPFFMMSMLHCYQVKKDNIALTLLIVKIGLLSLIMAHMFLSNEHHHDHRLPESFILFFVLGESLLTLLLFSRHFDGRYKDRQREALYNIATQSNLPTEQTILKSITHDLRTPIAGIMGVAELLKNTGFSPEQQELIDTISLSGQQALNKISEVSSHVQLQSNHQTPQKSLFELPLLIDECTFEHRPILDEKNIEFIVNIHANVPVVVYGDANRLRQILKLLIKNSVSHTSQGEILVNIQSLDDEQNEILFSIKDSGVGIAPQKLQSLISGEDLPSMSGLAMVHLHLKTLTSQLNITSRLGEGSDFNFSLKLGKPSKSAKLPNPPHQHASQLYQKRLLIIDDNKTFCRVLRQQASSLGMFATETYDGKEALAMYRGKRNLGEPFDAIIVDYDMPGLNGLEAATKLLAESDTPPIMIMLTGLTIVPDPNSLKKAGIHAVLNKPVSQQLIKLTLIDLFNQTNPTLVDAEPLKGELNILVAEDNDVSRRVISKMLDLLGYRYKMVSDGQLAFDTVKKEHFDVILMDCEMPVMDGFEATVHIHNWQTRQGKALTPVYALSAHILEEQKTKSMQAGMTDFLEKPVKLDQIKQLFETVLEPSKITD